MAPIFPLPLQVQLCDSIGSMKRRPSYAASLASALHTDAGDRGWCAFFPIYIICSVAIGCIASFYMPDTFWSDEQWAVSVTVYGGLLAFNGLLLALGWYAFSKIYEILSDAKIGQVLYKNDLLSDHLAFIDGNHVVLILATIASGVGLLTILMPLKLGVDRIIFVAVISTTLYALYRALSSTKMMSELVWEHAHIVDIDGLNGRHDNAA